MNARDNAAWLAMRVIGEAAVRTQSNRPADLLTYILRISLVAHQSQADPHLVKSQNPF
jgi:hypothetical protein